MDPPTIDQTLFFAMDPDCCFPDSWKAEKESTVLSRDAGTSQVTSIGWECTCGITYYDDQDKCYICKRSSRRDSTCVYGPAEQMLWEESETKRSERINICNEFVWFDFVNEKFLNVLFGFELYYNVFDDEEQQWMIATINKFKSEGQRGRLTGRTYSAAPDPRKNGRATIQWGFFCNKTTLQSENCSPQGINPTVLVDPIPGHFKAIIRMLATRCVIPSTFTPDTCTVQIYHEGDSMTPRVYSDDFERPYCTVSLLSECDIIFGEELKTDAEYEFSNAITLPVGSVAVFRANAADIIPHFVLPVQKQRISITFWKTKGERVIEEKNI